MPVAVKSGIKHLQFGYGDLYVSIVECKDTSRPFGIAVILDSQRRPINSECPEHVGKGIDELQTEVVMQFDKVESIDVMIDSLGKLRSMMTC